MELSFLLVITFLLWIIFAILIWMMLTHRYYLQRASVPPHHCPFGEVMPMTETILFSGNNSSPPAGIISYSLYGKVDRYLPTLRRSLGEIKRLLPTWRGRVYVPLDLEAKYQTQLLEDGAELHLMGPNPPFGHEGALWRFLPLEEDIPFLSLDADDVFTTQEVSYIQRWLKSDKKFCSLSDVILLMPLTGGRWGSRGQSVPDIRARLSRYCSYNFGFDEAFLKYEIAPIAAELGCWYSTYCRLDWVIPIFFIILIAMTLFSFLFSLRRESKI